MNMFVCIFACLCISVGVLAHFGMFISAVLCVYKVFLYVYDRMSVGVCVYVCICVYDPVCLSLSLYVCLCVVMYLCFSVCLCVRVFVF